MPPFDDFTAVILAGGSGSRMGGANKPLIEVDGEPIIMRMLKVLTPLFSKIIIAGGNMENLKDVRYTYVADSFPGKGPLAGIEAALSVTTTAYLFVFAGDMPSLSAEIITAQATFMHDNPCDIVIPRTPEGIEPLHAVIDRRIAPVLSDHLRDNKTTSVRHFYLLTDVRYFDVILTDLKDNPFKNINTPEDLQV